MNWVRVFIDIFYNIRYKNVVGNDTGSQTKWLIVGTGYMARTFGRAINGTRGNRVVCICSRSGLKAWKMSLSFGGAGFSNNLEQAIKKLGTEIDVVYVATPLKTHLSYIQICCRHGVNVLCEKPIVRSTQEMQVLRRNTEIYVNSYIIEAMWLYSLPTLSLLVSRLEEYSLNDERDLHVIFSKKGMKDSNPWDDYGTYTIAIAQKIIGTDIKVIACNGNFNSSIVQLKGKLGRATIEVGNSCDKPIRCKISSKEKVYELNHPFNRTDTLIERDLSTMIDIEHKFDYTFEGFEHQVMYVSQAIKSKKETLINEGFVLSEKRTFIIDEIKSRLL